MGILGDLGDSDEALRWRWIDDTQQLLACCMGYEHSIGVESNYLPLSLSSSLEGVHTVALSKKRWAVRASSQAAFCAPGWLFNDHM